MIKVGITGGIGSGKSIIARFFNLLDIPVYDSDKRAKNLINSDIEIRAKLINEFGESIYKKNGALNRQKLSKLIFENKNHLNKVNAIVHPVVRKDFFEWGKKYQHLPYILQEAAILFESGAHQLLDAVITVYAPEQQRIKRISQRDQTSVEQIKKRINNQMDEEKKKKLADFIIFNDEKHAVIPQIIEIDAKIKKLNKNG